MRYLYAVIAIVFIFSVSAMAAETAQKGVAAARQGGMAQGKEIETDDNDKKADDKEYDVDNEREMPQHETYDQNTGLPNVVPSDKEGELE